MLLKRIQLGLIHVAVAMTLVPINSTLNRIMIKELALAATLVAVFASLPYLFSPIQVAIGSFSDRHPFFGLRRSPYIALGLLLCVGGVIFSPYIAFQLSENLLVGMAMSVLVFGAWGMGFNFASVSYFALASEISGDKGRSRTIAAMFFMMILGIIFTATLLGRLLDPYTPEALIQSFSVVGGLALILGIIGLIGLEERSEKGASSGTVEHHSWRQMWQALTENKQAVLFFWYLILLLVAILGQDILLEPYGAEVFGLAVNVTTQITGIWGGSFLLSLVFTGIFDGRVSKFLIAKIGAWGAIGAFILLVVSGFLNSTGLFYVSVVLLGLSTGLSTVSNLSLMLDMTTADQVGLFIGAWGMANAFARLSGNMISGVLRDSIASFSNNLVIGYQVVFGLEAVLLVGSLLILRRIDVGVFQQRAKSNQPSFVERAAIAGDM